MPAPDVLIVGGGVIGLSCAWELARRGRRVTVLERDAVGVQTGTASWAGAGMLPPAALDTAVAPRDRLRAFSHARWDDWDASLREDGGVACGYERCGSVAVGLGPGGGEPASPGEALGRLAARLSPGVRWEPLPPGDVRRPPLGPAVTAAIRVPDAGQVRNPRLLKGLRAACEACGVTVREGAAAHAIQTAGNRAVAVRTVHAREPAGAVLVCGGPWTAGPLRTVGFSAPVRPVRGQMVLLRCAERPFGPVIECGPRYLVPRDDGRVLVGATQEPDVGFDARTTVDGVAGLLQTATELVPALTDAEVERAWAGLRPGTPDGAPLLGPVPHPDGGAFENLHVAAGHFRDGLQQSPGTAAILADLLDGRPPPVPLDGLAADRFLPRGSG